MPGLRSRWARQTNTRKNVSLGRNNFGYDINQTNGENNVDSLTIHGPMQNSVSRWPRHSNTRKNGYLTGCSQHDANFELGTVNQGKTSINNFPMRGQRSGSRGRGPRQRYGRGGETRNGWHKGDTRYARSMDLLTMKDLETKDPTVVMFTLLNPKEGFQAVISQPNISRDKLVLIISLLAQACKSEQKENLKALLKSVHAIHQFTYISLQSYLGEFQNDAVILQHQSSLGNLLLLLEATQELDPQNSIIDILLPQIKEIFSEMDKSIGQELVARFNVLETKRKQFKEKHKIAFLCRTESTLPPNDFRTIPLFPDSDDLSHTPHFLRANIVEGRYQDTDHYLDVHFRLLREDFVRPLREGIAEYVKHKDSQLYKKLQNVRAYLNVHVQRALITKDGIIHEVKFNVGPHRHIDWETSKRLLFGSLLCFSCDNFNTMIFGTVAIGQFRNLSRGILYVRFEDHNLSVLPTATFVMLESTESYFEAYRHNLIALQSMDESTLPFKEFIVEVSNQVKPPSYLEDHTNYCLEPVLKTVQVLVPECDNLTNEDGSVHSTDDIASHCSIDESGHTTDEDNIGIPECGFGNDTDEADSIHSIDKDYRDCIIWPGLGVLNPCRPCHFREIFNDGDWPTCIDMELDPSQFEAFKLALTKQLAIIQGPPGTGKTHVGLKIMEALLHNRTAWETPGKTGQILVICYTNHALDQFLEGVLKCTNSVVRIGGRCQNATLSMYTMSELRRIMAGEIRGTRYIRQNEENNRRTSEEILRRIHVLEQNILERSRSIISEDDLTHVIGEDHFTSLNLDCPYWFMRKWKPKILYWLGLGIPGEDLNENERDPQNAASAEAPAANKFRLRPLGHYFEEDFGDRAYENYIQIGAGQHARVIADRTTVNNGEWRIEGGKNQKRNLTHAMEPLTPMPDEEIKNIKNVWHLSYDNRRRLYKAWMEKSQIPLKSKLEDLKQEYLDSVEMENELRNEKDFLAAKNKYVVGMTTTGAAKFRSLVRRLQPQIIIVEEAAEVLEAHIITALTESTQHLILIGDHQQLRPNPTVYDLSKRYNLDVSLFERLINNGLPYCRLGIQHRMKPCISKLLVPHIYESLEDHKSVKEYKDIRGIDKCMFFINHNFKETTEYDSTSRKNEHEAEFLVRLCRYLLFQGYEKQQITILATYTGQLLLLKRVMSKFSCDGVRVSVVDNYQGEENDIILLSLVRSNEEGNVGFLKVHNRVCVALSRAKKGLYCIGNFDLLKHESKLWENIYEELLVLEAVGPSLKVTCKNHGTEHHIKELTDFDDVPDGGCTEPCDFRLECGHACVLRCHPFDAEHKDYRCKKPCHKILCSLQHECPMLCYQKCGKCQMRVAKVIPACGHELVVPCHQDVAGVKCEVLTSKVLSKCKHDVRVPCHLDVADEKCKMPCPKILGCGHECSLFCGDPCGSCNVSINVKGGCGHLISIECTVSADEDAVQKRCREKCERKLTCEHRCPKICGADCPRHCGIIVESTSLCGHVVQVPCHMNSEDEILARCSHPCRKVLDCGHLCSGNCSSCHQGKIHVPCVKRCGRRLICGHFCDFPCCKNCPSICWKQCKQRCPHGQCQHPCTLPCYRCRNHCASKCYHVQCTKECSEPCNRPPCTHPCSRILKCQHECIGFCGEPCPKLCRICDHQEVTTIYFGEEDDPHARFVELEDCGHIFEVDGLEQWIKQQDSRQIKLLSCPKCNTPIFHNTHFSNLLKNNFARVEEVKGKIFEQITKIKSARFNLQSSLLNEHRNIIEFNKKSKAETLLEEDILKKDYKISSEIVILVMEHLSNPNAFVDIIVQMENFATFVRKMKSVEEILSNTKFSIGQQFSKHIVSSLTSVSKALTTNISVVSTQLMEDIRWELYRVVLLTNIVKQSASQGTDANAKPKTICASAAEILMKMEPFRKEQLKKLEDLNIDIVSKDTKATIRKPLNLRQGHWYQCLNSHPYYMYIDVGEGDKSMRFCNECQAVNDKPMSMSEENNTIASQKQYGTTQIKTFGSMSMSQENNSILNKMVLAPQFTSKEHISCKKYRTIPKKTSAPQQPKSRHMSGTNRKTFPALSTSEEHNTILSKTLGTTTRKTVLPLFKSQEYSISRKKSGTTPKKRIGLGLLLSSEEPKSTPSKNCGTIPKKAIVPQFTSQGHNSTLSKKSGITPKTTIAPVVMTQEPKSTPSKNCGTIPKKAVAPQFTSQGHNSTLSKKSGITPKKTIAPVVATQEPKSTPSKNCGTIPKKAVVPQFMSQGHNSTLSKKSGITPKKTIAPVVTTQEP